MIDNLVVISHKVHCFRGRVEERIVVMKEPAVVAPMFWSFSLRIFSQTCENVTVKVRVDCSVRRNNITVSSPPSHRKNNEHARC
jgi:hypothetical protein